MKGVNALDANQQQARNTMLVMTNYAREEGLTPKTLQGDAQHVFQALSATVHKGNYAEEAERLNLQQVAAAESNDPGAIRRTNLHVEGLRKVQAIHARLQA